MVIYRDYRLDSETDFRRVQPLLSRLEAEPLYTEYGDLVGWRLTPQNTSIQELAKRVLLDYQFDTVSPEDAAELAVRCLALYGEK